MRPAGPSCIKELAHDLLGTPPRGRAQETVPQENPSPRGRPLQSTPSGVESSLWQVAGEHVQRARPNLPARERPAFELLLHPWESEREAVSTQPWLCRIRRRQASLGILP